MRIWPAGTAAAILGLVLEGLGLGLFHVGLLTFVACYGLWTSRMWGLKLTRGLAVFYIVASVIAFIASLIARTGILTSMVGLALWAAIAVYLFGRSEQVSSHVQKYYTHLREPVPGDWGGYR